MFTYTFLFCVILFTESTDTTPWSEAEVFGYDISSSVEGWQHIDLKQSAKILWPLTGKKKKNPQI